MSHYLTALIDASAFTVGTFAAVKGAFPTQPQGSSNFLGYTFSIAINTCALNVTPGEPTWENALLKVACLTFGTLVLITVAKPLSQRTGMVLSPHAALELAAFHGCLKAILYGIHYFYTPEEEKPPTPPIATTPPPQVAPPLLPDSKDAPSPKKPEPAESTTRYKVLAVALITLTLLGCVFVTPYVQSMAHCYNQQQRIHTLEGKVQRLSSEKEDLQEQLMNCSTYAAQVSGLHSQFKKMEVFTL